MVFAITGCGICVLVREASVYGCFRGGALKVPVAAMIA
jgi:hypothetical protein